MLVLRYVMICERLLRVVIKRTNVLCVRRACKRASRAMMAVTEARTMEKTPTMMFVRRSLERDMVGF